jgi:MFS family permease
MQRFPLYLGGLMGPFGTMVILPMFPELRDSFGASSEAVGWGFTLYFIPFALVLVVSGTLGERWGRRRTVRATFLLYALASLGCAVAPNLTMFLVARGMQGLANAFITPLLLAGLADIVPEERFGRTVGIYGTFQALGGGLAPLIGGLAAEVDWRWAFVGTALVAAVLSIWPPPGEPRRDLEAPPMRPLFSRRMVMLGFAAFTAATGPIGVAVIVGVAARDELDLSGGQAGALLLSGSLAASLVSPYWGRLLDRLGTRWSVVFAVPTLTALVIGLALLVDSTPGTAILWAVTSMFVGFVVVILQSTAAVAVPSNRGGALSATLSYRFLGHAVGPVIWLPVFARSPEAAYVGAGALGLLTLVALLSVTGVEAEPLAASGP